MIFFVQFGINKLLLIQLFELILNYAVKNENKFLCSRDFHHQILRLSVDAQVLLFNLVFLQCIACQTNVLDGTWRMINEW